MPKKNQKITVIGSGAMGTAAAKVLYQSGYQNITIYGINPQELDELSEGKNTKFFSPEVFIPPFKTSSQMKEALDQADYVLLAVPSITMKTVAEAMLDCLKSEVLLINLSKGFYPESNASVHQGLANACQNHRYIRGVASLIGPSHAEEIILEQITFVAAVAEELAICQEVQQLFKNQYFRTYAQTDVIGAEVGACFKNVLAIASGIMDGLGLGINTKAALLTRGMQEAMVFNHFLGGKTQTLLGLTGIGDLIVTAFSEHSRNFQFGKDFAQFGIKALETKKTVEGLTALKMIHQIALENQLDLPLIEDIFAHIFEHRSLEKIIENAFSKEVKSEF